MKNSNIQMLKAALFAAGLMGLMSLTGCDTAPPTPQGKTNLRHTSAQAVSQAEQNDPTLEKVIGNSVGYAVFPSVGKGAVGVGGAYGKGDVYQDGAVVGYCDMTQGSVGLQLGGQDYTEILVFQTPQALASFKTGDCRFDAQTTAVALKSGAGANAKFAKGVAVFTMDEEGLMYEASIGGQKFDYQPR